MAVRSSSLPGIELDDVPKIVVPEARSNSDQGALSKVTIDGKSAAVFHRSVPSTWISHGGNHNRSSALFQLSVLYGPVLFQAKTRPLIRLFIHPDPPQSARN